MYRERRPPTFYDSARDAEFGETLTNLVSLAYGAQLHQDREDGIVTNTTSAEKEIDLGDGQRVECDFYAEQDEGLVVLQSRQFTELEKPLEVPAVWKIMDDIQGSSLDDAVKQRYYGIPDRIRKARVETFTAKVVCVDVGRRAPAEVTNHIGYCIDGHEVVRWELADEEDGLNTTFDGSDFASILQAIYVLGLAESEQMQAAIRKLR
jgi:hypothetical protein